MKDLTPGFDRWFQSDGLVNYDVSPDGSQIVVAINSTPPPYRDFLNKDIYLVPTDGSGQLKNLTTDNKGNDDKPVFAPDGGALLYLRTESPYYNGVRQTLAA